ncbi:MAG TPA: C39 family peptidase [Anaerolineae bacterium]|nr:C39 family peptidase [Anaerolineae bacterium]HQI84635.1 C39 family peptidase [Anaerolineae bacterium]
MSWLNVPHYKQNKAGWCLPACIEMVSAYWHHPLSQAEAARLLAMCGAGASASRIQRLTERGFEVTYTTGSLSDVSTWLSHGISVIVFVRTVELPYWNVDTPHALILVGVEVEQVHLLDPAVDTAPVTVSVGDLMLAWSYFDYTYAALKPSA